MREAITRLRYRYWPDHWLGEILSKRWTETAIPVLVLLIVGFWLSQSIHNFLSLSSLADTARQACEIGFIALGMALVVIVGGIDLSVGSMFALTDFCALYTLDVLGWPVPLVVLATIVSGMLLGAVNGFLIGYLRLRAFITTLITLIIYRSAYDLLIQGYSNDIAAAFPDFPSWNFLGGGSVFGIPSVALLYIVVAIFGHIFLTRLRPGWHVTAIGGSRVCSEVPIDAATTSAMPTSARAVRPCAKTTKPASAAKAASPKTTGHRNRRPPVSSVRVAGAAKIATARIVKPCNPTIEAN